MKRAVGMACIVVSLAVLAGAAQSEPAPAAGKSIALVPVGSMDAALMARLSDFVGSKLRVPVRVLEPRAAAGGSLNDEGLALDGCRSPDLVCIVALVEPRDETASHGVLLPESGIAVINVRAMQPAGGDAELYARRLQRQAVRSVGLLMDLGHCPNPLCALYRYSNEAEMDAIAMELCPPCAMRCGDAARARGAADRNDEPLPPE